MICPNCGKQTRDGSKFCQMCGYPMGAQPAAPANEPPSAPPAAPAPKSGGSKQLVIILVILAAAAALLLGAGVFVLRNLTSSDSKPPAESPAFSQNPDLAVDGKADPESAAPTSTLPSASETPVQSQRPEYNEAAVATAAETFTGTWYDHYSRNCTMTISHSDTNRFPVHIEWSEGSGSKTWDFVALCTYNAQTLNYTDGDTVGEIYLSGDFVYWYDSQFEQCTQCFFSQTDPGMETAAPSETPTESPAEVTEAPAEIPAAEEYIIPDSNTRRLTEADLAGMTKEQLSLARNELYARHGRLFNNEGLQSYFNSKSWYHGTIPADEFRDDVYFNDIEKDNRDLIKRMENAAG